MAPFLINQFYNTPLRRVLSDSPGLGDCIGMPTPTSCLHAQTCRESDLVVQQERSLLLSCVKYYMAE